MSHYQLTWITPNLAVGYAPMSYAELDSIREQGIDAIVNLCGEYCDLHEIEEGSGFEVYYLPIPDEGAPDMESMEKALEWLDEAIYLGKKVLVHCRHGIGRTGTFVTAYLIRRGLGLKTASKKMKDTRANPTNYTQWKLLRKYGKRQGVLKIREPSLESRHVVDLSIYFSEYEALVQDTEAGLAESEGRSVCGRDTSECCMEYFELTLMEAIYVNNKLNKVLRLDQRREVINRAVNISKTVRKLRNGLTGEELSSAFVKAHLVCPLNEGKKCILFDYRPIRCRTYGAPTEAVNQSLIDSVLENLSKEIFFALSGVFLAGKKVTFPMADVISGRFVQEYFHLLASIPKPEERVKSVGQPQKS